MQYRFFFIWLIWSLIADTEKNINRETYKKWLPLKIYTHFITIIFFIFYIQYLCGFFSYSQIWIIIILLFILFYHAFVGFALKFKRKNYSHYTLYQQQTIV